jgi:NAD(P)-dependent dehydrogenase (short-subunit alcohol dehydrogenase family)
MSDWRVKDQVIVVTGASKGIGLSVAKVLVERGARVAVLARREARLLEAATTLAEPGRVLPIAVDVCNKDALDKAFHAVIERWGRLDGLVNNVGFQFARRLELMPEEEIRKVVDLNFLSAVFGCQCAIPRMRANGGGRIVNISSASVRHWNEFANLGMYSARKAALDHFTNELREELIRDRIMVTLFSPGAVATDSSANFDPKALEEAMGVWLERGPMFDGGIGDIDVIGEAIAHCFEYPPGVTVEFMEVKPRTQTPKLLADDWTEDSLV